MVLVSGIFYGEEEDDDDDDDDGRQTDRQTDRQTLLLLMMMMMMPRDDVPLGGGLDRGESWNVLVPVKCPGQHQVVVDAQLVQPLVKVSLVDEPSGSVDDDERKDHPAACEHPTVNSASESTELRTRQIMMG